MVYTGVQEGLNAWGGGRGANRLTTFLGLDYINFLSVVGTVLIHASRECSVTHYSEAYGFVESGNEPHATGVLFELRFILLFHLSFWLMVMLNNWKLEVWYSYWQSRTENLLRFMQTGWEQPQAEKEKAPFWNWNIVKSSWISSEENILKATS